MRLLQLHAGYRTPAGEDTVVAAEADAFAGAGHEVHQLIEHNPPNSVRALGALSTSAHNRATARAVSEAIAAFRPDVVHVHNTWFALSSSVLTATADAGVPLVMTLHNYRLGCLGVDLFRGSSICTACVGRSPLRGVFHGCYRGSRALSAVTAVEMISTRRRGTLDAVDRFVAPSAFMGDRLVDIGIPSDKLVVKPHFTTDAGRRPGSPSESDEILFIGRLAPGKGLEVLLRAWERRDRRTEPDLRLTIIGDGPLAPLLRESAPRDVEFVGWMPHDRVRRRMLGARALVFPSEWYEPFGMVLIEAMSAGLPIVASNASDAARITGTPAELVTPVGDENALASALSLLSDELVDRVGADSRRRFQSTYTREQGVAALESLYRSVIGANR